MYSDMSSRTIACSSSKRNSASARASSVLPTPVGPTKRNEPMGRFGSERPARERRTASDTALTASAWPMTPLAEAVLHLEELLRLALAASGRPGRPSTRETTAGDVLLGDLLAGASAAPSGGRPGGRSGARAPSRAAAAFRSAARPRFWRSPWPLRLDRVRCRVFLDRLLGLADLLDGLLLGGPLARAGGSTSRAPRTSCFSISSSRSLRFLASSPSRARASRSRAR